MFLTAHNQIDDVAMSVPSRAPAPLCVLLVLFLMSGPVSAQDGYQEPVPELKSLVDAPVAPAVSLSPNRTTMLVMTRQDIPSIAQLAQEEVRMAGMRINPTNNGPSRAGYFVELAVSDVMPATERTERPVTGLPGGGLIGSGEWSPDGKYYAFPVTLPDRIELFLLDVASASAQRLVDRPLNGVGGSLFAWMPDSQSLLVRAVDDDRGPMPEAPAAPAAPVIQDNQGAEAPARTYQDLLKTPHDKDVFEWLMASDLLMVDLDGHDRVFMENTLVRSFDPSPDGSMVLTQAMHRPFSFLVPWYRFPNRIEVRSASGDVVTLVEDQPLMEEVPTGFGSTTTGVRSISWRQDTPATLAWVEALDGGDGNVDADLRDAVKQWEAPFIMEPETLVELPLRYAGISWSADGYALVNERWTSSRTFRTYRVYADRSGRNAEVVFDYSYEDRYANPGSPMSERDGKGRWLLMTDDGGNVVYLTGAGSSEEGDRPFLRRYHLATGETDELFRSEAPYYERPITWIDPTAGTFLTMRESASEPPNYFIRSVRGGDPVAVTAFPHPYPHMDAVTKESITYEREDGISLSGTLYLPPGYDAERDGPLPTLIWAYPREFKSAAAAGQRSGSPHQFKRVSYSGAIPYVTQGYAVIDNAAMPVVGEGDEEPNDSFVPQLVMNAQAAIDYGVERGVVDPDRVAIAGHSYGAFMTANLLAHSDLFRAGIARSGAYNRSLTPFGFQAEPRTFWEAPEIYFEMSPFMHAHRIDEPILLIHGMADNNSGTFPIQSERFYHALKGNGATVRLVMLPNESHGYRARESVLHVLWETHTWLDTHVKNAPPRAVDMKEPTG